jgi:hypothetical protein
MLLVPHVLIRRFCILEAEDLVIHHWLDLVRIDRPIHVLKLHAGPYQDASDDASPYQCLYHTRLFPFALAQETDDGDDTLHLDCFQRLLHCTWAADLNDMIDSSESVSSILWGRLVLALSVRATTHPSPPGVSFFASSPQFGVSL